MIWEFIEFLIGISLFGVLFAACVCCVCMLIFATLFIWEEWKNREEQDEDD